MCVWWVGGAHQTALALRTDRCVEARVPRPTVAVGWRLLTERRRLAAEVGRACKRVLRARQRSIRRDRRQHGALQWGGGPSGSFRRQSLVLAEALRAATAVSAPAIKRVRTAGFGVQAWAFFFPSRRPQALHRVMPRRHFGVSVIPHERHALPSALASCSCCLSLANAAALSACVEERRREESGVGWEG